EYAAERRKRLGRATFHGFEDASRAEGQEERREQRQPEAGWFCRRQRFGRRRKTTACPTQGLVVEEKNGHRHCQKIEERIVAAQENEQLKRERGKRAGLAQLPWGEDQKRRHKLDCKRGERRPAQHPGGKLVGVPREDGRQRLRVEVILKRSQ